MLDNMDIYTMEKAVKIKNKRAIVEVSGNVNIDNINSIANIGIDYVSVGALTHSARILDLIMKNLRNL